MHTLGQANLEQRLDEGLAHTRRHSSRASKLGGSLEDVCDGVDRAVFIVGAVVVDCRPSDIAQVELSRSQSSTFALLDALGEIYLTVARQKRNASELFEISRYRVGSRFVAARASRKGVGHSVSSREVRVSEAG